MNKRNDAIEQALVEVRDDLNRRAEDGCVAVGAGVWQQVNEALPPDTTKIDLIAPTGTEARVWTDAEKDELRDAMNKLSLIEAKTICEQNGFAVVPVEPTDKMLAWADVYAPLNRSDNRIAYKAVWKTMLEAVKEVK